MTRRFSSRTIKAVAAALGATALFGGATLGLAGASAGASPSVIEQTEQEPPVDEDIDEDIDDDFGDVDGDFDGDFGDHDDFDGDFGDHDDFDDDHGDWDEDWDDLTPEEIAELEAEWAAEFATLSPEEQAEVIAEDTEWATELIELLDAEGITYTLTTDPVTGVDFPDLDQLDEATLDQLDALYDDWDDDWDEDWDDLTPEEIAELEAEWAAEFATLSPEEQAEVIAEDTEWATELIELLDAEGITYTLTTDPVTGVDFPDLDQLDEATLDQLDALYDDWDDHEFCDDGDFDGDFEDDFEDDDMDGEEATTS